MENSKEQDFERFLQERKTNLFRSLAAFQQECPTIHKGTQGYGYSYADLPTIFEIINPILKEHCLGFTQLMEGSGIRTILFHVETGETLETFTEIPTENLKGMNAYQSAGSGITYYRRYALSSMLGIVTDKDTDASSKKSKPTLTDDRFNKSVEAIKKGDYDKESLIKNFELSKDQMLKLSKV